MKKVYLLQEGRYYTDRGLVVAASDTKKGLIEWIKQNRPDHERDYGRKRDLFYDNDEKQTFLRHRDTDVVPVFIIKNHRKNPKVIKNHQE